MFLCFYFAIGDSITVFDSDIDDHSYQDKSPRDESYDRSRKEIKFSFEQYTLKSPKIPSGLVRSLCNIYEDELSNKMKQNLKHSENNSNMRKVGKLPGFEDYPNKSPDRGKSATVKLNRSRSFNCSSLSSTQDSNSTNSSTILKIF